MTRPRSAILFCNEGDRADWSLALGDFQTFTTRDCLDQSGHSISNVDFRSSYHSTEAKAVASPVSRVILYVKDVARVAAFYQQHFGMKPLPGNEAGWLELTSGKRGCNIALHKAASSQKSGAAMKIVFGVSNVRKFVAEREADGLRFGPIHSPGVFEFANAKDPAGNPIQVSSRGIQKP